MKKNKIDLKTVEMLVRRNQFAKIETYIEERQLDKEIALECFTHSSLTPSVIKHYTFEELFDGNLIKFIEEGYYFKLRDFVRVGEGYPWVNCFFKNSEELLKVNEYVKENYIGESIKDIIMPHRNCVKTYENFKDDYYNCIDGIEEILTSRKTVSHTVTRSPSPFDDTPSPFDDTPILLVRGDNNNDWDTALNTNTTSLIPLSTSQKAREVINMLETMPILKWSIVEKYIEKLSLLPSTVEEIITRRFYHFKNYSLVDLEGTISILDGFKEKCCKNISLNSLAHLTNPTSLDSKESTIEKKRLIYNKYMRDSINAEVARNVAFNALAFETDETRANKIFDLLLTSVRLPNISEFMKKVFGDFNYPTLVTKHMYENSKRRTSELDYILFPDIQLTADEIIDFVGSDISRFSLPDTCYNPFALRAIQLDTYSEEDMEKLSPYLHLHRLNDYFKDNFIPFDFAMKYVINMDDFRLGGRNVDRYTPEQLIAIAESSVYTSDKYSNRNLFANFLDREDITDELFVKLISTIGETAEDYEYAYHKSKSKASVKNILTLLN